MGQSRLIFKSKPCRWILLSSMSGLGVSKVAGHNEKATWRISSRQRGDVKYRRIFVKNMAGTKILHL
jgi:hypothetical protein